MSSALAPRFLVIALFTGLLASPGSASAWADDSAVCSVVTYMERDGAVFDSAATVRSQLAKQVNAIGHYFESRWCTRLQALLTERYRTMALIESDSPGAPKLRRLQEQRLENVNTDISRLVGSRMYKWKQLATAACDSSNEKARPRQHVCYSIILSGLEEEQEFAKANNFATSSLSNDIRHLVDAL
ncbi:MAG: hypothetical protein AAGI24_14520 [Pseudomonadota bacterium]